uniref:Mediator of RNA polymerase II transcription subunit 31 n=1 Tax=Corethrella appendiculata TaxID=1370023 RepID=U5EIU3_9DIPT
MANKMLGKGKLPAESEDQQKLRFQIELEFVQCLANPNYLHFLAQRGFFKESNFINYLKYLLYWKEPEYAKYLKYPICLYFLDLLQYEHFRREIVNAQCCKFIDDQVILLWQHYTRRRTRLLSLGGSGGGNIGVTLNSGQTSNLNNVGSGGGNNMSTNSGNPIPMDTSSSQTNSQQQQQSQQQQNGNQSNGISTASGIGQKVS